MTTTSDDDLTKQRAMLRDPWPSMVAELRRLRSGVGLIACPDHGQIPDSIDPDVEPCARCGGYGAVGHEEVLAELRAARDRIAALVAALDESLDLIEGSAWLAEIAEGPDGDERVRIARLRALAHPTEGDPAP